MVLGNHHPVMVFGLYGVRESIRVAVVGINFVTLLALY
jgi:hypothetical protein